MFRRRSNTAPHRVLARADAGTEAADACDRCSRQQDGAHRLGLTGDGCDLSSSGRSGLKPPAIRRRRRRRRVKRRIWRTLNERRIGKPVFHTAPRARGCDLDPVCELPYRPAATERPQHRPNRCQHPDYAQYSPEDSSCVQGGVHRCEIAALLRTPPLVGIPHPRRPASLSLRRCHVHGHTVHIDAAARL